MLSVRAMSQSHQRELNLLFIVLWLFIITVSVVDGYLVLQYRTHLTELNPQGQLLIALNGGRVWYLLAAKYIGTVLACSVLLVVYQKNARVGMAVALVLAILQFCLLLFLMLA
jgi:hypothetical protein